jgi:acetyl-CoA carboxylase carboxyl transferase subunit alpha
MPEHHLDFEKPLAELRKKINELKVFMKEKNLGTSGELENLEKKAQKMREEIYKNLTPWQTVQIMRHLQRPKTLDYINLMFTEFTELHGDRSFGDDKAIVCGLAKLDEYPVMAIGLQKGKDTKENIMRKFGSGQPEGYRKALRLMKLAEKFGVPVVTFIDTNGAFPGLEGEERGVAEAIARNLLEMARLKVPIIICIIGEGGSGGALGIGVGDRMLMMKYATYSVISPEGAAAILWRDSTKAPEAARIMKTTAKDLLELKVIDEIVEEPVEGAHRDYKTAADNLRAAILRNLKELIKLPPATLTQERYKKFRRMGIFTEVPLNPDAQSNS